MNEIDKGRIDVEYYCPHCNPDHIPTITNTSCSFCKGSGIIAEKRSPAWVHYHSADLISHGRLERTKKPNDK